MGWQSSWLWSTSSLPSSFLWLEAGYLRYRGYLRHIWWEHFMDSGNLSYYHPWLWQPLEHIWCTYINIKYITCFKTCIDADNNNNNNNIVVIDNLLMCAWNKSHSKSLFKPKYLWYTQKYGIVRVGCRSLSSIITQKLSS